jgi:hypothetical protein
MRAIWLWLVSGIDFRDGGFFFFGMLMIVIKATARGD